MNWNRREAEVKTGILAYLETRTDWFGWNQVTSAGYLQSGMFVRSNMKGVSDIIGMQARSFVEIVGTSCLPTGSEEAFVGVFTVVECKREKGGKLSSDQIRFRTNVINHGGRFIEARSVDEVARALGPVRFHIVKVRPTRKIFR